MSIEKAEGASIEVTRTVSVGSDVNQCRLLDELLIGRDNFARYRSVYVRSSLD